MHISDTEFGCSGQGHAGLVSAIPNLWIQMCIEHGRDQKGLQLFELVPMKSAGGAGRCSPVISVSSKLQAGIQNNKFAFGPWKIISLFESRVKYDNCLELYWKLKTLQNHVVYSQFWLSLHGKTC